MPIGHIVEVKPAEVEKLQNRLIQEWKNPDPTVNEPILIVQPNPRKDGSWYIYVIWQAWENLTLRERSEIIMEAYAATHSKSEVLRVTAASGLTRAEAEGRKLFYTLENTDKTA